MTTQATAHWDDHRRAFAQTLGLSDPVPGGVLQAALADDGYAQRLMIARRHPQMLQVLLDNPPTVTLADEMSPLMLLRKAARSLARWGGQGFATVDDETLNRRRAACAACEHARIPADVESGRITGAHCNLCGCNLTTKTRLPHESCPAPHAGTPGLTRWGEAIAGGKTASDVREP